MFILLVAALFIVAGHHGGFIEANQKVLTSNPELFSRPGGLGKYTPGIWFSFIILWFFCDPMFPQLFQRFFSAKNDHSIFSIMVLYPLVCTIVFFMPISVGVLGHLSFPDLVGKQADRILPLVLTAISGDIMAALVIAAGLAALMSTMDSQLLTLSSIFTRDVVPLVKKSQSKTSAAGRVFVILLSLIGLGLAYNPPSTILQIATQTFTGLAVLFPTVIFGLYFKKVYPLPAILSILCGEGVLIIFYLKILSTNMFLPVITVMMITFAVYLTAHGIILWRDRALPLYRPQWLTDRYVWIFLVIFSLAMDFWAWEKTDPLIWGIPLWVGYFVCLSALQTIVMVFLKRRELGRKY